MGTIKGTIFSLQNKNKKTQYDGNMKNGHREKEDHLGLAENIRKRQWGRREVDGFQEQAQVEAISLGGRMWDIKKRKEAQMTPDFRLR